MRVCLGVVAKVSKNDGENARIEGEMGVRCVLATQKVDLWSLCRRWRKTLLHTTSGILKGVSCGRTWSGTVRKHGFTKCENGPLGVERVGGGEIGPFESGKSISAETTEDEGKPFGRMKGLC